MIEVSSLSKTYGQLVAMEEVSFNIGKGEIVGLLGPNGAGKTTLIRTLTGYFEPSHGQICIHGMDIQSAPSLVQEQIGYLAENTPVYPEMLVQEYLTMIADIRDIPSHLRTRKLAEAIHATGLTEYLTRPIGQLSKGFRQRVGLAQAIVHEPKVLILDEPTSGLDPTQVVHVRNLIKRLAQKTTVLFSTHILSEVEQLCDRVIIMLGGKIRTDARITDLQSSNAAVVAIAAGANDAYAPTSSELLNHLIQVNGVTSGKEIDARHGYHTFELQGDEERDICLEVYRAAQTQQWEIGELRPVVNNLETVFRQLVRTHETSANHTTIHTQANSQPTELEVMS